MTPEVKISKVTIKQAKWLKEFLKHGNGTKAALAVYDTKDSGVAANIASENVRKLQNPMAMLMEAKGITPLSLIETVDEARQATKYNDFSGEREADHFIRLKAVDRLSKWAQLDPKETSNQTNIQVNMGISFDE